MRAEALGQKQTLSLLHKLVQKLDLIITKDMPAVLKCLVMK